MRSREESPRVLVVEDEEPILDGLRALFEQQGFVPVCVGDGEAALEEIAQQRFALVILDLMLPKRDGLSVLTQLRGQGDDTPVLVLTARGTEQDVVSGLEAGADDYVTKPFAVRELVARAKGLLRRPRRDRGFGACFKVTDRVVLDLNTQTVRIGESPVRLTARETILLSYLIERRHRPVTREELLVDVWGYNDGTVRTRTVDVHVQQLRAKLRKVGGEAWVATVRGRGYRFTADLVPIACDDS